ncbi:hypothetical protein FJV20_19170 [Acinetobacter baumannii]|uniref:hypothetical protein n=1 Tax=Acinetobacter baumannii TaxID=470 RepID=UPI00112DA011|nr:hypothetical protein [Acinetobacter baumannii]TPV19048.1 hypothetical protein FJV20_19170 [Acinetobacter baumannii]
MKPEQFIREFGEKKARAVVESASENHNKFDIALDKTVEAYKVRPRLVDLHYLKRLVESLDLIKKLGGRSGAIREYFEYVHSGKSELDIRPNELARVIRDHESIYGGGDE